MLFSNKSTKKVDKESKFQYDDKEVIDSSMDFFCWEIQGVPGNMTVGE